MNTQVLSRVWWFPSSAALPRPTPSGLATYCGYDLDEQPKLADVDPHVGWLRAQPSVTAWALDRSDEFPQRRIVGHELNVLLGDVEPPPALAALAADPGLQRKMRSYTGCYFDLGDTAVPTDVGATLVHLVADQQWVRHWLVLVGPDGQSPVLSTTLPLGFDLGADESPGEEPIPDVVRLDGSLDLTLSADSVEQFLYRFWIENEIAFRAAESDLLTEPFASYVADVERR